MSSVWGGYSCPQLLLPLPQRRGQECPRHTRLERNVFVGDGSGAGVGVFRLGHALIEATG